MSNPSVRSRDGPLVYDIFRFDSLKSKQIKKNIIMIVVCTEDIFIDRLL